MLHETVQLLVPGAEEPASLVTYAPGNFPELGSDRQRPAVIICPGGGYHRLSAREAEPVALRFAGMGYAAFILRYHVAPRAAGPSPSGSSSPPSTTCGSTAPATTWTPRR